MRRKRGPRASGMTRARPILSLIPCATCGALPIGEFRQGKTADDGRYYDCGPHSPLIERTEHDPLPGRGDPSTVARLLPAL